MTVVKISGIHVYVGASGDSKPTTGVAAGSLFRETDTYDVYIYTGSAWVKYQGFGGALWPLS